MSIRHSRLVVAAAGVVTIAGLTFAGASAANAATPAPHTHSHAAANTTGVPFRAISAHAIRAQFGDVPASLRTDLKALKGKKGAERRSAVEAIESKALSGGYGTDVQSAAQAAKTGWATAPASLKSALKAVRHAAKADRAADLATIESKALDGGYGQGIETWTKTVQKNVEAQQAKALTRSVGSII